MTKMEDYSGLEVLHHEAVTPLFTAIEEMDWREAFDIAESNPIQVQTWVRSTGTEHTTFDWSVWRRLPIHEACRRQAPAWLISELLSKFPESANYANNQGELPLHIAVDKACAPEVVNLIIVANWKAIVAQDQAGRTPLDIIDRGELLQLEDYRIVFESLRRCYKTYMDIQRAAQEEQASLKRKQKATFSAISHRHQEELKAEHDKQAKIRDEVEDLKAQIEDMKEVSKAKDHKMKKHQLEKERWSETIRDLEASAGGLKEEVELRKAQIRSLENSVRQKESELIEKGTIINLLSQDLKNIAISNDTELMHSLVEAEDSMRKMVSKQIALQKLLASKSESLTGLLNQRGISLRAERRAPNITEEKSDKDPTSAMDDEEAASAAMMAAALSALQRVNS